jgi:uncharacterized protein
MIFVDTSAWLAVSDVRDGNHRAAIAFYADLTGGRLGRLITSSFVLDEALTLMRRRAGLDAVRRFVTGIERSPSVQQIWVTPAHYRSALALFLNQGDRSWSFTDCTSFEIMRELGIQTSFTFDSDFRQAGFEAVPI